MTRGGERGIWLLRHAAVAPAPRRRLVGARNLPLSAAGRDQARALAGDFLPAIRPGLRAVLCSALDRCVETAELMLAGPEPPPPLHVEPEFAEIRLGLWEGRSREEIRRRWPGAFEARGLDMAGFVPPGGESFRMVERRALHALARWRERYPEGALLIVTHSGVMRALLARYWGLPLSRVWRIPERFAARRFLPGW